MKPFPVSLAILFVSLFFAPALLAQSPDSANQSAASSAASAAEVPRLIKFSGTLVDAQDRPMAGPVGVTFALHAQQTSGAALWIETQNVTPDAHGNYTVLLGANSTNGVPAELFASGEARWLEVQVERQVEQPRILLVSVPYALKAKDAETLGGRPASAFLTTETLAGSSAGTAAASTALPSSKTQTTPKKTSSAVQPAVACTGVTSDGTATVSSIAMFTAPCTIQSSLMTQALINGFPGVNVAGNNAGLLLNGTGTHQLTVTGLSSGRLGQDFTGFFFSSDTKGKVIKFLTNNGTLNEWMRITSAGNVGIGTTAPAAKLDVNGNLNLPNTTSPTVGVISLGGTPFLHNFGSRDTFAGASAGNMTMTGSNNAAFGWSALTFNTSGQWNSAFGANALTSNAVGNANSAFGYGALQNYNLNGDANSAFGFEALQSNTTGPGNSAFGVNALLGNTTGGKNSAFGFAALASNTTGAQNAGFGYGALNQNTASGNAAFGFAALNLNTTGRENSAFGTSTLLNNSTGFGNSAFGNIALTANIIGTENSAFGDGALANNTATANSAFGYTALLANTTGTSNSAFGTNALFGNTTGPANSAFGVDALTSNTIGSFNAAFGNEALASNQTGSNNAAFGNNALFNNTADKNSAFGFNALTANTIGSLNAAFGAFALQNNNDSNNANNARANSAFGYDALTANTIGSFNAAFGTEALASNQTGSNNSAFGEGALFKNTGHDNSAFGLGALSNNGAGGSNTAVGVGTLSGLISGNLNVALGKDAGNALTGSDSNNIIIGNTGVAGDNNFIRIGAPGAVATFIAGISGATVATGDGVGVVIGSAGQLGTIASSRRFKDDIVDMAGESDLLMKLRPVSFYYKPELDPTHTRQYGLVAEEVAQVSPQLVVFDKDGVPQTVRYHFVNAMLLNEVQKQQSIIARQQAEIQDLAALLVKLEALVAPVQ